MKWVLLVLAALVLLPLLAVVGFLIHVDLTVFSTIKEKVDRVNSAPQSITPSQEFIRVFCHAPKRPIYGNVVKNELHQALRIKDKSGWALYGAPSTLLAYVHFSDAEVSKYLANTCTTLKDEPLQIYSLAQFHHGLDSVTCQESAELESVSYGFHSADRTKMRQQKTIEQLCGQSPQN